ncbi:MAG: hypothetical protein ACREX3_04085 [Gammaproteobacteria bacterium]
MVTAPRAVFTGWRGLLSFLYSATQRDVLSQGPGCSAQNPAGAHARGGKDAVAPLGQIGDTLRQVGEFGDEAIRTISRVSLGRGRSV